MLGGDTHDAIAQYQAVLGDSDQRARRTLATSLVKTGRLNNSFDLFHKELVSDPKSVGWLSGLAWEAITSGNLKLGGDYATVLAALRWGSRWYPAEQSETRNLPVRPEPRVLTVPKLWHDIQQFEYLQRCNKLGREFTQVIADYHRVIDRMEKVGPDRRVRLDDDSEALESIGHVYNRIIHVRNTPTVDRALSSTWNPGFVEQTFLEGAQGVVVIDDFLSGAALENICHFCLESTIWNNNRYKNGRLGAFFNDGFNCPLLLQIADELKTAMPRVIGDRHSLRQIWGFKMGENNPQRSAKHADFAAVNVNFWITPDSANLDQRTGGLVIFDMEAPLQWDFQTYNNRPDLIDRFLRECGARAIEIPYRQNRAILFNSDLFHCTGPVQFRSGYDNRRINITLLYGTRQHDSYHKNSEHYGSADGPTLDATGWRSDAFALSKRRRR